MSCTKSEVETHYVAHFATHNNSVVCNFYRFVAKVNDLVDSPTGQLLRTGDDYWVVLVNPEIHGYIRIF